MENKYDVIISIDIGLSGGISFFDSVSTEILSVCEMPIKKVINKSGKEKNVIDLARLLLLLERPKVYNDSAIVIYEDVHAFPGQGVVAVGTLLEQKGIIRGMAKALGYDELPISPREWQKHFGIVCPKEIKNKNKRKEWLKNNSLEVARNNFPEWSETKLEKSTAHGLSDSMLLGLYYIQTHTM